jgi:hypothetical protein
MNPPVLNTVMELLKPAVFLAWPAGTKGSHKRWKHLTLAYMKPRYLQRLSKGNVGVAFGQASTDEQGAVLCGIDLDQPEFVKTFMEANPMLREGWLSRGRPDRLLIIVRVKGGYPKSCKLVDAQGVALGEWRADGCQSIVPPSIHPDTGKPYELVSANKPLVIEYQDIHWPSMVSNIPAIDTPTTHNTLLSNTEFDPNVNGLRSDKTHFNDVNELRSKTPYAKSVTGNRNGVDYEDLVEPYIVTARGHSNAALLALARGIKRLEAEGHLVDVRRAFLAWWEKSSDNVDPSWTADQFLWKLKDALERANGGGLDSVWQRSEGLVPPGAECLLDKRLVRLAAIGYLLDQDNGGKGFYLGCRKVAELFKGITHMVGWQWIKHLERRGLFEKVENGKAETGKASHYRYTGQSHGGDNGPGV